MGDYTLDCHFDPTCNISTLHQVLGPVRLVLEHLQQSVKILTIVARMSQVILLNHALFVHSDHTWRSLKDYILKAACELQS